MMKRSKLTDFVLNKMKWTGVFLYEPVYLSRVENLSNDIKNQNETYDVIFSKHSDLIKSYSVDYLNNRIRFKIGLT